MLETSMYSYVRIVGILVKMFYRKQVSLGNFRDFLENMKIYNIIDIWIEE
jgi:hypothetical protein